MKAEINKNLGSLLSAYKGLNWYTREQNSEEEISLLSAYKGLNFKLFMSSGLIPEEFIKCL